MTVNRYYDRERVEELVRTSHHRKAVGGLWDELGEMQLDALRELGMRPDHTILDVGCGSLRAGRLLVEYLAPAHYHGIDLNQSLLDAGYENELTPELQSRLPRSNLVEHDVTQPLPMDGPFDYLIAFSLFTHLPVELTQAALMRISETMAAGSQLLATFFVVEDGTTGSHARASGIVTHFDKDPFQLCRGQLTEVASAAGLDARELAHIRHPRGQSLFVLTRNLS